MSDFDFSKQLVEWYSENKRDLPWRNTTDPYAIWVSEIMLQQTRVEAVKPYYFRFLSALPDVASLADAEEDLLFKLWQGLGYYSRVKNMQKAAKICLEKYGGALPKKYEELLALPGIGEYTAGAIASFAYSLPYPAVDGNVERVLARYLGYMLPIGTKQARDFMKAFIQKELVKERPDVFNQALIELGASLCGPDRTARCGGCPLLAGCHAFSEGKTELLPIRPPKIQKKPVERTVLIIRYQEKVVLKKRPDKGLLAGLWEPVTLDGRKTEEQVRSFLAENGIFEPVISPLPNAKHVFTHLVWEMQAYLIDTPVAGNFDYFERSECRKLAVPSAYAAYFCYLQP